MSPAGGPPNRPALTESDRAAELRRMLVLGLLVLAPLAFGAVYEWGYTPLLVLSSLLGFFSWRRARAGQSPGLVPGLELLLALHGLILLQLVPLPPGLLRLVSPGSFHIYNDTQLVPLTAWKPISVSPADSFAGLLFLGGMSLLFLTVFHDFRSGRWRRRLARTVVLVGVVMTFEGLIQAASGTQKIYGFWAPRDNWAIFGPYVSRTHFAGYLVMAIPIALGFASEAARDLRQAWGRRREGWLTLGEPVGSAFVRRAAEAMVLVVGLVASASRGGFVAFVFSLAVLALASRHRRQAIMVMAIVAALGISWIGLDTIEQGFRSRGLEGSRLGLWRDALRMLPDFPAFGLGWNAFGTAYMHYQTFWRYYWFQAAHNEYLDVLLDAGVLGAAIVGGLVFVLFRAAGRRASHSPLDAGILGALAALSCHNLVDFNWQIPANAATFVALAALATQPGRPADTAESGRGLAG